MLGNGAIGSAAIGGSFGDPNVTNVSGVQTLSPITQSSAVAVAVVALATQTLAPITQTSSISVPATINGVQTTQAAIQSASAKTVVGVRGVQALAPVIQTGFVKTVEDSTVDAHQTLPPFTQRSSVKVEIAAAATQQTQAITQTSEVKLGFPPGSYNAIQTMRAATQVATVGVRVKATGHQIMKGVIQTSDVEMVPYIRNVSGHQIMKPVRNRWSVSIPATPRRILLGRLPSGARGLRISQAGYDAGAHPVDNERLIFSSEWPEAMQIYMQGNGNYACGRGAPAIFTIPFPSLGYVPYVEFVVRSGADTIGAGGATFPNSGNWPNPNVYLPRSAISALYYDIQTVDGQNYLRLNIADGQLRFEMEVRNNASNSFGYPLHWWVYWTIFRKKMSP